MNIHMKKMIGTIAAVMSAAVLVTGCAAGGGASGSSSGGSDPGFTIPKTAQISDFDWYFGDSSALKAEEYITDPNDLNGVWEVCVWRKPDQKTFAQKEVYWLEIMVEKTSGSGSMPGGTGETDPSIAADVYGMQAFQNSEEAEAAGLGGSSTATQLIEMLSEGDGSIGAAAILYQVGVEDADGNWKEVTGSKPVYFEGKLYPEMMYLTLQDEKGNWIKSNTIVAGQSDLHAIGVYSTYKNNPALDGLLLMCRKIGQ